MNNKNGTGKSRRAAFAALVVCAIFAAGFGAVGVGALWSLTTMLHSAWAVRSWQMVPIEVLDSGLQTSDSEDSTTYSAQARYRYEWAGRQYESTRIGLPGSTGRDNFDDWHHNWEARLRAARADGPPLNAWIDPKHPERALLDPHLRWRNVLFMLPFAVLFPLVAFGALFAGWVGLTRADPARTSGGAAPRNIPRHNALGLWIVATVMCTMALPAIAVASAPATPIWVGLIGGLFAVAGVALLRLAVRATRQAWACRGAFASFQPAQPRAGAAFQATWALPQHAAARWPLQTPIPLRVAQYRIDDSGSSASERLAEDLTQQALPQLNPDGSLSLRARFELPADAPSQGARREGDAVDWRFEWLDAKQAVVLAVPIPVQAAAAGHDSAGTRPAQQPIPAGTSDNAMPPLPAGVSLRERPDALVLSFGQTGWRWLAIAALIGLALAFSRSMVWLEVALLAVALQAISQRWTLEVSDDGVLLDRTSWMWRRRILLPASCLQGLYSKHLYNLDTGQRSKAFHALWARGAHRGNDLRITPGLQDNGTARIERMLRWAFAQRGGRFSPGERRAQAPDVSRAGWAWAVCLLWVAVRLWSLG